MHTKKRAVKNLSKGFTLVEVTVAILILASTFAAAGTVVAEALVLVQVSRQNTEATALMQQGISRAVSAYQSSVLDCPGDITDYTINPPVKHLLVTTKCGSFSVPSTENPGSYIINGDSSAKIVSTVIWRFKNRDYHLTTTQYTKKD